MNQCLSVVDLEILERNFLEFHGGCRQIFDACNTPNLHTSENGPLWDILDPLMLYHIKFMLTQGIQIVNSSASLAVRHKNRTGCWGRNIWSP